MKKINRLLYLVYHENILASGILYTQVLRMLTAIKRLYPAMTIVLLSYISPHKWLLKRSEITALKKKLHSEGVILICLPMLVPQSWHVIFHPLILLWSIPTLLITRFYRCQVIHPRGYFAAFIALGVRKFLKTSVIFDPRGPYPEEMLMNNIWTPKSISYKIWKRLEGYLIRNCDCSIGVTPEFRDEFAERDAPMSFFVPNRTDTAPFIKAYQNYLHISLPTAEKSCEILFIGEFHSVWNNPQTAGRHLKALLTKIPNAKLRVITRADRAKVLNALLPLGMDESQIIHQTSAPHNMPNAMQGSTFGIAFCAISIKSMWPVKIAEYLAAGLPLIIDRNFPGIVPIIITKHRLGFIADPDNPEDYSPALEIVNNWQQYSQRCVDYARKRLDISSTARQHMRIYRSITST